MNPQKATRPKNDPQISDQTALDHIHKLDNKIKSKNTIIIILIILILGIVTTVTLHQFGII